LFNSVRHLFSRRFLIIIAFLGISGEVALGNGKTTAVSGNWTNPEIWNGTTSPSPMDDITIPSGQTIVIDTDVTVKNLTVSQNSTLTWTAGKRLTINGNFSVSGTVNMNGGLITLGSPGLLFTLNEGSVFTWDPGINTSAEATLFTRGTENFAPTSTLIIKRWYNYATALGSVITGNFGNLTLNSLSGTNAIVEWNQANQFQTHKVLGTFTIDQGWITLDKSGSISHTEFSAVTLTSVNSFLYGHNGNHPGSFTVATGNIENNGGTILALSDGTGNVSLLVNGNFNNKGNVKLIMNSGVAGAGNGNAVLNVSGAFSQVSGDTRFIYNVSSVNSGVYTANFGSINLSGGIFMGQTGCHVNNGICKLSVAGNFTVAFNTSSDKFRGTSLSNIGSNYNNAGFELNVGGDLSISGPSSSEFTTSASSGSESVTIGGNFLSYGSVASINYGTAAASHQSFLQVNGNLIVNGGSSFLTRNAGTGNIHVRGNLSVLSGMLIVKASTGAVQMQVAGDYQQSGGTVYLHMNPSQPSPDKISVSIGGSFSQSAGVFSFDDNSTTGSATHELILLGGSYSVSGTGSITQAGAGTSSVFGLIKFMKAGVMNYQRANGHQIRQIIQQVGKDCQLNLISGNIQVISHNTASTEYFKIFSGGTVRLGTGQFFSEGSFSYSGIQVDSGGTLSIEHTSGLYNGSDNAAINSNGNMDYFLHSSSIVEYSGQSNQTLTGTVYAMTSGSQHKYGILRLSMQNESHATIYENQLYVRTRLELRSGKLNLNGNTFVLENGKTDAVNRTGGHVQSENDNSIFTWKNITEGVHEFPFGNTDGEYIPVLFAPTAGAGNQVSISTRGTASADNTPNPTNLIGTVLSLLGLNYAENEVVDRWWKVDASGITANVTLHYPAAENTLNIANRLSPLGLRTWNGIGWSNPRGYGFGVLSGTGSVNITNVNQFSNWILVANNGVLPIELALFQANVFKNGVRLDWVTSTEINNDYFTLERSETGEIFEEIGRVQGAGNSGEQRNYHFTDESPISGRSYYRLKQTDYDGKFSYSEIRTVRFEMEEVSQLEIEKVWPNPFDERFDVTYILPEDGEVKMILSNSSGKAVQTSIHRGVKGINTIGFSSGAMLQSGNYILQLICESQTASKKIIRK
jgi:hypothetical protein